MSLPHVFLIPLATLREIQPSAYAQSQCAHIFAVGLALVARTATGFRQVSFR